MGQTTVVLKSNLALPPRSVVKSHSKEPWPCQVYYSAISLLSLLTTVIWMQPMTILRADGGTRGETRSIAVDKPTQFPGKKSRKRRRDSRLQYKRQTIDEKMIEADQYNWGGEGDGAEVCKRFSHQSTLVGDIVYIFGGQASTSPGQKDHMWSMYL